MNVLSQFDHRRDQAIFWIARCLGTFFLQLDDIVVVVVRGTVCLLPANSEVTASFEGRPDASDSAVVHRTRLVANVLFETRLRLNSSRLSSCRWVFDIPAVRQVLIRTSPAC